MSISRANRYAPQCECSPLAKSVHKGLNWISRGLLAAALAMTVVSTVPRSGISSNVNNILRLGALNVAGVAASVALYVRVRGSQQESSSSVSEQV